MMLTVERLREVLNYDLVTGIFTWKISVTNSVKIGDVAGSEHSKGYLQTSIDGRKYFLHSLAWYKDLNKKNNVWENLRDATRVTNNQNVRVKSNSSTGFKNVYYEKRRNKYRVSVRANGKRNFVGYYSEFQEACQASESYMIEHHGEYFTI